MVQFLSIIFLAWISSIFVGFFKSSHFFVSPCIRHARMHMTSFSAQSRPKRCFAVGQSYLARAILLLLCDDWHVSRSDSCRETSCPFINLNVVTPKLLNAINLVLWF